MRSIREIIESALRYLGAIVSPESGATINLVPANIHNRDRAAEELRLALKLLPGAEPWPVTADDPDEIQSGKYDEPGPDPAAERLLDALANNGCGLPYPEMLALVRAYREQVREEAGLTFDRFQAANVLRCGQAFKHGLEDWSLLEWAGALAGEVGEAANICKKIRRHQQKIGGKWAERDPDMETLKAKLADEIGDAGAYLVLLAAAADLVLSKCVAEKFDAVSEAVGWNGERLSRSASQEGGAGE